MAITICGNINPVAGSVATGDGTTIQFTAAGTSGQVLQSNGASAPTWVTPSSGASPATPTVAGVVYGKTENCGARVAIGYEASLSCSGGSSVAIGYRAGRNCMGGCGVAIGRCSATMNCSVAIGSYASNSGGFGGKIAVGWFSKSWGDYNCVAIGNGVNAGTSGSGTNSSTAIGGGAGARATGSIALGASAYVPVSATNGIAIGKNVSATESGLFVSPVRSKCIAGGSPVGLGYCTLSKEIVYGVGGGGGASCATPTVAGVVYGKTLSCSSDGRLGLGYNTNPAYDGIAIGRNANDSTMVGPNIIIGNNSSIGGFTGCGVVIVGSGSTTSGSRTTSLGYSANARATDSIAIGNSSSITSAGGCGAVAIGRSATVNAYDSVAVGRFVTVNTPYSVAIGGTSSGGSNCGNIAIGYGAGGGSGGSISIGYYAAGSCTQGANSISIGTCAKSLSANSIAIGYGVTACASGLFVDPVRNVTGTTYLGYNASTKEITYSSGAPSDINLKQNIQAIGCALNKTAQIRGVTFDWKSCGKNAIGVIAQEIESVFPQLVTLEGDGYKTVKYDNMVAVLIEAVKELKTRVEALESKS